MELSFGKCKSILDTLPIGFYTGRRVPVQLDDKVETSFYDPMNDRIVVSYPIINDRLQKVKEGTCNEEEAVRSMLYHEVSHAILTPGEYLRPTDIINIFEDERIESVLRHYYHGVNFRKQLYDVYGGHAPKAKDSISAFFNAVRFGLGTGKVQKAVNELLKEYAEMNRSTPAWGTKICTENYEYGVRKLYEMIKEEFGKDPEAFQDSKGEGSCKNQSGMNGNEQMQAMKGKQNKEDGDGEGTAFSDEPYKGDPHEIDVDPEQLKKSVGACLSRNENLDDVQIEKLNDFQRTAEMIIGNFNKKNKGGSGINSYGGVFNPRAVARQDYRYFERSITTQGNNKFGSCHLNLIIDCSGSFYNNVPLTNGILAVLSEIERKNRNFTMDVAFINDRFRLCKNVQERKMQATGGNAIPDDMKEILIRLQKPQTCNYNIVLFDGDAICQDYYGKDCNKMFSVFDMKQTTLITDPDNEKYMNPPFTSTKVVVTKDYTKELIDHIIHALTIAFG